jgi:hypothetical protein
MLIVCVSDLGTISVLILQLAPALPVISRELLNFSCPRLPQNHNVLTLKYIANLVRDYFFAIRSIPKSISTAYVHGMAINQRNTLPFPLWLVGE